MWRRVEILSDKKRKVYATSLIVGNDYMTDRFRNHWGFSKRTLLQYVDRPEKCTLKIPENSHLLAFDENHMLQFAYRAADDENSLLFSFGPLYNFIRALRQGVAASLRSGDTVQLKRRR